MPEEAKPQPTQQEAARAAVVESFKPENGPEGLRITPQAREMAKGLRSRVSEGISALKHPKDVLTRADTDSHLKKHIGTELTPLKKKNENGDEVNTEAGERFDRAQHAVDRIKKLEQKGYEGITDASERQEMVHDVMEHVLKGREDFDGLSDAERFVIAETVLKDRGAVGKIAETMKSRLENPQAFKDVDEAIGKASNAVEDAKRAVVEKDREIRGKNKEISRAKRRQGEIDGRMSDLLDKIDDDRDTRDDLLKKFNAKTSKVKPGTEAFREMQTIVAEKSRLGKPLTDEEEQMKEYIDVQGRLDELPKLQDERAKLPGKIDGLTDELDGLKDGKEGAEGDQASKQRALDRAIEQRNEQEERFVAELESSLADGADEWFDQAIEERNKAAEEELKKKAAEGHTEDEKFVFDALRQRHFEKKMKRGGKIKTKIRKRQVYHDTDTLLTRGKETMTRDILMQRFPDEGNDEQRQRNAQERARIDQWLKDNSTKAEDLQNEIAQQIMTTRMRVGPIYEGETMLMQREGLKDVVEQAVKNDEAMKVGTDELIRRTGPASVYEGLRHHWGADSKDGFWGGTARATIWSFRWLLSPTFAPNMIKAGYDKYYRNKEVGREYPRSNQESAPITTPSSS